MQLATLFLYIPGISLNVFIFKIEICRIRGIFISAQSSLALFFAKAVFFKSIKKIFFIGRSSREKGEGREAKKINLEFLITAIPRMVVTFGCWTFGLGPNYLTTSQLSLTSHEPMQDWALIERDLPLLGAILYTTEVLSLD